MFSGTEVFFLKLMIASLQFYYFRAGCKGLVLTPNGIVDSSSSM
jgi:hypothetical protein